MIGELFQIAFGAAAAGYAARRADWHDWPATSLIDELWRWMARRHIVNGVREALKIAPDRVEV